MPVVNERGHFLSEAQKEVKQKIMVGCIDAILDNLAENQEIFQNPQHIADLIFSVLIMLTRDTLALTFKSFGIEFDSSNIMDQFCSNLKEEVSRKLKEDKND